MVNILGEPDSNGDYHINDKNNSFLIVNPQIILSGTTILGSLGCLRKYVTNIFNKVISLLLI
jgi:hypothetical protein